MAFNIKVDGEVVHSLPDDQRVTHLTLMSSKGAIADSDITPDQGEVNLIVTYADPKAVHLYDLQAQRNPQNVTADQVADVYPPVIPNTEVPEEVGMTTDETTAHDQQTGPVGPGTISGEPEEPVVEFPPPEEAPVG